ncbi:short-chain dehydrogenase/reductase [Saccharibacillus sp. O16]|nr:short-chain dehydrogenase/reductase [Saccharibacillus sp. O16]
MQTWFITGASGGLAAPLLNKLLTRGDRVAATVRRPGVLDEWKAQYGDRLWVAHLDLTDLPQIEQVVERAFEELGEIDVVVNNAAYGLYGAIEEASDEQIRHQFETNVFGSLKVMRAAMPFLRNQGHGHLIQLSSMAGHYSIPGMGFYCSSKWAIEGAFEALAKEAAPFGIRSTMVEPGGIRTPFITSSARYGERMDAYREQEAGLFTRMMQGEVPGMDDMEAFKRMVVGDPEKMAQAIIERSDAGEGPLRMALGSDAYREIRQALLDRLAALDAQQELAYSTDADDVRQEVGR